MTTTKHDLSETQARVLRAIEPAGEDGATRQALIDQHLTYPLGPVLLDLQEMGLIRQDGNAAQYHHREDPTPVATDSDRWYIITTPGREVLAQQDH